MTSTRRRIELTEEFWRKLDEQEQKRKEHDERYALIRKRLIELELDPYELRDYLASLD